MIEYRYIEYFLKTIFTSIFTMYLNYKILNIKEKNIFNIIVLFGNMIFLSIISAYIIEYIGRTLSMVIVDSIISILFSKIVKKHISFSLIITTISLTTNYILYSLSIVLNYFIFKIVNISNEYIVLLAIILIYSIVFYRICRIKRLKNGIAFFKNNENNQYFIIITLNTSCIVFATIATVINEDLTIERTLFIYMIIVFIIMFITIQKSLQLYYKQKLQERETEDIKEELNNKNKELDNLKKENIKINKKYHSLSHKQKSLEYELNQMILNNQISENSKIKDKMDKLTKDIKGEEIIVELPKTQIDEIDNMLKYMQSECIKSKIDFQLQINGNIYHMINNHIKKEDLEILIADLVKNAIIAINYSENTNKSILVRLGIIDGFYSLYVYDSGIEFEKETLKNLGTKPSTTHEKSGGTGMGFMNIFDTLKKYKASLTINEIGKPVTDNFTKIIKIVFDNKTEYKIISYRQHKI